MKLNYADPEGTASALHHLWAWLELKMNHSLVRHSMCQCMWAEISFSKREKKTERLHLLKCAGPTEIAVVFNLMGESWETVGQLLLDTLPCRFLFLSEGSEGVWICQQWHLFSKQEKAVIASSCLSPLLRTLKYKHPFGARFERGVASACVFIVHQEANVICLCANFWWLHVHTNTQYRHMHTEPVHIFQRQKSSLEL